MGTHQYHQAEFAFPFKHEDCFYCGKRIDGEARFIYWRGNNRTPSMIFLHPECAIVFAAHLTKDALTYAEL